MNPIAMTIVLTLGWGLFTWSAHWRWNLLKVGTPDNRFDQTFRRLKETWTYAFVQIRMRKYPIAGLAHMFIFLGFIVLLPRTIILWGRGFDEEFSLWFLGIDNPLGRFYSVLKDGFAVLVVIGAAVFAYFRLVRRLPRLTLNNEGLLILGIIAAMMMSDVLYDAATLALHAPGATGGLPASVLPPLPPRVDRVAHVRAPHPPRSDGDLPQSPLRLNFQWYEPAGSSVAILLDSAPDGAVRFLKHAGFWTHSCLVLLFLNLLPYSKHFHIITAVPNVYLQNLNPARLAPIADIEGRLERGETLGVRRIDQFSWKSLLDLYTCTECGRCSDHCPATHTGKKLSPKHFTIDLRNFLYAMEKPLVEAQRIAAANATSGAVAILDGDAVVKEHNGASHQADLIPAVIDPEVLWACTTCRACEEECPVFISYVDKIVDLRRHLVMERGEFPTQLQAAFKGLESSGNPWSFPQEDRLAWAANLGVKTLAEHPDAAVLFWVGCAPAYDERAKKVTRATVQLMQQAGVDFAVLGNEETCTGDPARRAGNEYLFQILAKQNVQTLNGYHADKKTIVATCPHCFNTLLNEYPDFGGAFNVVHHTTFLAQLVRDGKIKPTKTISKSVVYHDSCYLGRYNDGYDAPREALRSIPGLTVLEPQRTRQRGMCCGAGGAQMFKEEERGDQRVNVARTSQLLETKPDAVSSACPFCMRMLTDGLAEHRRDDVPSFDVAELLWEASQT